MVLAVGLYLVWYQNGYTDQDNF